MKMDNPTTITVLGSIIAALVLAVFGIIAGKAQDKQSKADQAELLNANKSLSDSLNKKNEELLGKSNALIKIQEDQKESLLNYNQKIELYANDQKQKDKQIIELQQGLLTEAGVQREMQSNLVKKSDEIANLYQELYNYQTGGNSFCYLNFNVVKDKVFMTLKHEGKYPLRDVNISINAGAANNSNTLNTATGEYFKDIIGVGEVANVAFLPFPKQQDFIYWKIRFQTRDGINRWYQDVVFVKNEFLSQADEVVKRNTKNKDELGLIHDYTWQVFRLTEKKTPTYFKIHGDTIPRRGADKISYDATILMEQEFRTADSKKKFDWNKY